MNLTVSILGLLSTSLLGLTWWRRRELYLLPSTWILIVSALIYVVPAAIFADEVRDMSPFAVTALTYCSSFITFGLLINLIWARLPALSDLLPAIPDDSGVAIPLAQLLAVLALITVWYLLNVPLQSTGLYGVLFDPENSAQLREESLKLLTNPLLKYIYLIGFTCISPLTLCLLLSRSTELHGFKRWAILISVLGFLAFYLLLTGARVGIVNLVVVGLFYAFIRKRMHIDVRLLAVSLLIMLAVPIAISILREQGRNEATMIEYVEAIAGRVFLLPLLISGWFVEYADTHGPVGLMQALGIGENINWSNLIALEYLGRKEELTIDTVTTPTSFFFSNYLYFGWAGLLPSLLALRIIDLPMSQLRRISPVLRLPLAATLLFFSVVFVQSGFGVSLLSHGYVLLIFLVFAIRHRTSGSPVNV